MKTVKGQLTHRRRQALATQKLIVETAQDLFLEHGYTATTIEAIAAGAGVAASTIYAIFGSKRGILSAIREAWHEESGQRSIYQTANEESDPRRRLELAAHATRRQWETGDRMVAVYRSAATADAEAAEELNLALQGRRAGMNQFINALSPSLRPGLDSDRAAGIFRALTLHELYQELVDGSGWSPDEYETWLADLLKQQLL